MTATLNPLLPHGDAEADGPVEIDLKYEYISAPKYFDFAVEERAEDIIAVEAWFQQAPADTESRAEPMWVGLTAQVTHARAMGKGLAAMDFRTDTGTVSVDKTVAAPASEHEDMVVESLVAPRMAPAPDLPPPGNTMETRSQDEASQAECSPEGSASGMLLDSPQSAIRAKSLYSELCDQAVVAPPVARGARRERESVSDPHGGDPALKKRKLNEGSLRQMLDTRGPVMPARSTAPLTIPTDFHFHTDHRLRPCQQKSPYVPMAEKVFRFQRKTPPRFHTVPPSRNHPVVEHSNLHLTVPREPSLETAQRARPSTLKPAEEREVEALAAAPRFKARPFNVALLQSAAAPSLNPSAKPALTQIHAFQFATAERALHHPRAEPPITRSASKKATERERRERHPQLTRAVQPRLQTATRARVSLSAPSQPNAHHEAHSRGSESNMGRGVGGIRVKSREEAEAEEVAAMLRFKARPISRAVLGGARRTSTRPKPTPPAPRVLQDPVRSWNGSLTVPHPFALNTEERGAEKSARWQRSVEAERLELRSRSVPRALPLPLTTDFPKPPPKPSAPPPTTPLPFHLLGLQRHAEEERKREEEARQQEVMDAQRTQFVARPNRTKHVAAFVPQRSRKPLTRMQDFTHHADSRATERAKFDDHVRSKTEEVEEMRASYAVQQKAEEVKAIRALRRSMVPHPLPLPNFIRSQTGTTPSAPSNRQYPNLRSQMR